jgi:hypothetical protein
MEVLMYVVFAASMIGFVTASVVMFKLIKSKKDVAS